MGSVSRPISDIGFLDLTLDEACENESYCASKLEEENKEEGAENVVLAAKPFEKVKRKDWKVVPNEMVYQVSEVRCHMDKSVERHCSDCAPRYTGRRSEKFPANAYEDEDDIGHWRRYLDPEKSPGVLDWFDLSKPVQKRILKNTSAITNLDKKNRQDPKPEEPWDSDWEEKEREIMKEKEQQQQQQQYQLGRNREN